MRLSITLVAPLLLAGCTATDAGGSSTPAGDTEVQSDDTSTDRVVADADLGNDVPNERDLASDRGGLDVEVVGDGEALVTWSAPSTRSDGTDLSDSAIAGYRVHYGTTSRRYSTTIDVGRAGQARITGLTSGPIYYFAVTAYDLSSRESAYSVEVSKAL